MNVLACSSEVRGMMVSRDIEDYILKFVPSPIQTKHYAICAYLLEEFGLSHEVFSITSIRHRYLITLQPARSARSPKRRCEIILETATTARLAFKTQHSTPPEARFEEFSDMFFVYQDSWYQTSYYILKEHPSFKESIFGSPRRGAAREIMCSLCGTGEVSEISDDCSHWFCCDCKECCPICVY